MDWVSQSDDLAYFLTQQKELPKFAQTLQQRFAVGRSYTWIGQGTLLSLGAHSSTVDAKTSSLYKKYGEELYSLEDPCSVPPHVLQLASTVFNDMLHSKQNQSVVFT